MKSITTLKQDERNRIIFVEKRDGREAAYAFCKTGITTYREVLFTKRGREIRIPLICSYIMFKSYVREYEKINKIEKLIESLADAYTKRTGNMNFLGSVKTELMGMFPEFEKLIS